VILLKLSCPAYKSKVKVVCGRFYCVPDLEFDVFIVDLEVSSPEFHPDGQVMLLSESFVCELEEEARFTDS